MVLLVRELTKRERQSLIVSFIGLTFFLIVIFLIPEPLWFLRISITLLMVLDIIIIIWILLPRQLEPNVSDVSRIQLPQINEELRDLGIFPEGAILEIIDNVAYCDPEYARKAFRAWPWRAKGRIILTKAELIFISVKKKKINFVVPIATIKAFYEFVGRGGSRTYKVCEILYRDPIADQQLSVLFMGTIGFKTFDMPSEIELKSLKLMAHLQKWYETWTT